MELGLNHPLGPFKLGDLSGLDIGYNARLETYELTKNEADRPPKDLEKRVKRGDLGRKTGRGFYQYDAQGNKQGPAGRKPAGRPPMPRVS